LAERKRKLLEGADCIVSLPGGIGTLDEIMDAACLKQLGFIEVPACLDATLRRLRRSCECSWANSASSASGPAGVPD